MPSSHDVVRSDSSRWRARSDADAVTGSARRRDPGPPVDVRDDTFRADYADCFEVAAIDARPAEAWARGTLEGCPALLRGFATFGWRYCLGLRLRRGHSPDHVAGWPVVRREPALVVLGVESLVLGRARLTFETNASSATVSSHVEFDRRGAGAVWAVVGLLHRRIVPYMLGHAARHRDGESRAAALPKPS
jgi:hypothetical protein